VICAASFDNFAPELSLESYICALLHRCPNTAHGRHEPNIVLKDNDLKHKLRIPSNLASLLIDQLDKDAKLLCDILHVMDYSLLGMLPIAVSISISKIISFLKTNAMINMHMCTSAFSRGS
jgi:hypothetical protein